VVAAPGFTWGVMPSAVRVAVTLRGCGRKGYEYRETEVPSGSICRVPS
jgi:hypothetical protein